MWITCLDGKAGLSFSLLSYISSSTEMGQWSEP